MGKVVTSQGIVEFVQTGKHDTVENHKPGKANDAPALEVKKEAPDLQLSGAADKSEKPADVAKPVDVEHDEPLTDEEKALPEKAQKEIQRAKRAVNKKHAEMKEAQEAVAEAERFAETQFNERKLLEQRTAAQEERIRELEAKIQPPAVEKTKPTIDDKNADGSFKYRDTAGNVNWDLYTDDKADFAAEAKLKERDAKQAEERAAQEREAHVERIKVNAEATRKEHPDFDQVMAKVQGTEADRVPQFVLNYIYESENSAGVAYYLATHPDESQKIAKLPPIRGIKELGKIEDSLVKPSPTTKETPVVQGATHKPGAPPPPITPLSGSGNGTVNTDPSKMSYKELRAYERARARDKRQ